MPWVEVAEAGEPQPPQSLQALTALEHELVGGRRLLAGAAGSAAWLTAGVCLASAAHALATDDARVAAATGILAVVLLAVGAWVGTSAVRAGRRVQQAHERWLAASADPLIEAALPHRQVVFRSQPRLLLGALCLVGAAFACLLSWWGAAPGDPGALGDGRGEVAAFGLVAAVAFGVPAGCLIGGEVRAVRALAGRVVRTAAARRHESRRVLPRPVTAGRLDVDPEPDSAG